LFNVIASELKPLAASETWREAILLRLPRPSASQWQLHSVLSLRGA